MQTKVIGYQLALDGESIPIRQNVWSTPIAILRRLAEDDLARCDWCDSEYYQHAFNHAPEWLHREHYVYLSPWDTDPRVEKLCVSCAEYEERNGTPEDEFYCDACNREIVNSNGHRVYYRILHECEMICVACWQSEAFTDNAMIQEFIDGDESAPFDFYDHAELREHGFAEESALLWRGLEDVDRMRQHARDLIADGWHVIIDQGSTSIMGDEGSVTFWIKPIDHADTRDRRLRKALGVLYSAKWHNESDPDRVARIEARIETLSAILYPPAEALAS